MATVKLNPATGKVSGTNSNMPLVIIPSEITNLGSLTSAEADSVRIYSDASLTTELAREIVSSDEIHVNISSVSSSTEIWLDYDGVRSDYAVTDTYGRNNVWSDYIGVWHMYNATSTTISDSTGNGWTLTKKSSGAPAEITGKIGKGQEFDNSNNEYADGSTSTDLNPTGDMTVQCLFRSTNESDRGVIFAKNNEAYLDRRGWLLSKDADGTVSMSAGGGGGYPKAASQNSECDGTWKILHGRAEAGVQQNIAVNGVEEGSDTADASFSQVGNPLTVGYRNNGFGPDRYLDADLDELRLRASYLSDNWISTENENQNDNGAFWEATEVVSTTFTPIVTMF